jgi:putative addiction module killer protein
VVIGSGGRQGKGAHPCALTERRVRNFGDCEAVGEGVSEMRVHVGPGYRVYFTRTERTVYVLLTGGYKATQSKDIARAKTMARAIRENQR